MVRDDLLRDVVVLIIEHLPVLRELRLREEGEVLLEEADTRSQVRLPSVHVNQALAAAEGEQEDHGLQTIRRLGKKTIVFKPQGILPHCLRGRHHEFEKECAGEVWRDTQESL